MAEGAGDASGGATGVQPGALTALLQEVAAAPERGEVEPISIPPGTVIGRFEIIRELGRGGFGVVYEARDRDLGRQVAVKVVRPGRITEEEGKASREAEAIARLAHPNLITLFEVGRSEHGPFLVFELLRGKTLDLRLEEGPLPVHEAVHIAAEVARGLAHAHAEGVIHRDLKPANVFVTNKGQVKVLDFGMAHAFGRRRLSGGTPAYMAPEQWEDAPEDERTDVFALGVMLYRMLTAEYPFPEGQGKWSSEPAIVRKLEVPGAPELAELVEKMLDPTPTRRPRDGAAVLGALTPIEENLRARPADGKPPEHAKRRKATVGDLLAELKRRHVFRVMVGYGIFAFAMLQVTEPIMHGAHLPDWVLSVVLALLALGFPVAVILAWVFDLTAQGVKRRPLAMGSDAPSFGRSRVLLPLAVAAAVLAIAAGGAGAWYRWKQATEHRAASPGPGTAPSIAVLPFKDLSPNHDQEYFSDGVAEEILNALANVEGLHVPGRTSSFWFKGKNAELDEIGRKLRVTHVLEGSVRRSGRRVRVTAQIVAVRDGYRVWSETFDRDEADIFAVQDQVAKAAVAALKVMLLPGAPTDPGTAPTKNLEAYHLFLIGRSLNSQGTEDSARRAIASLERAIAMDPSMGRAHASLADATWNLALGTSGDERRALLRRSREEAERAVSLARTDPAAYAARAWARMAQDWDWDGAQRDLEKAVELAPGNKATLNSLAALQGPLGRFQEGMRLQRLAVEFDPLNVVHLTNLAWCCLVSGDFKETRKHAGRALEISPGSVGARHVLGFTELLEGNAVGALEVFQGLQGKPSDLAGIAAAAYSAGREQESLAALTELERLHAEQPFLIASVHAWRGDKDGAFRWLERAYLDRDVRMLRIRTLPLLRPIRADPRYVALLKKMNLPVD